ncbi:MAG: hypothetical protein R3A13_10475 [Bdellovibrionota bacterium]
MTNNDKDTAIYEAYDGEEPFDFVIPEKNLLRAILTTAMNDLKKSGEVKAKATEYFLDTDEDYIFSFRSVCDFLSVDPNRILIATGLSLNSNQKKFLKSQQTENRSSSK